MNYLDVNVDLLEYVSKSKNIETITYNKKKSLEIFTPLVFISKIKDKYDNLINSSSGKVLKIEEWGLLNLANKIKHYNKGFYIHYKFEGDKNTLNEMGKKIKLDGSIIRSLTVKYKKLDTTNEYFKKK